MEVNCVYTVHEIALWLKVSDKTIYKLIHDKHINCCRVRGQIRITSEQIKKYLEVGVVNEERNTG